MTESIYLGINAGHTRSVAIAVDDNLDIIGLVSGESLNLHTYPHVVVSRRFEHLLEKLARNLNISLRDLLDHTSRISISMAGASTKGDQALVKVCLLQPYWSQDMKFKILDDTWAGLIAGTFSTNGTCVFAGTGASVYVNDNSGEEEIFYGKPHKIDGWGPLIGDFGSGFQLATHMFRFFGRELDKSGCPELFNRLLEKEPSIRRIEDAQRWFDALYIMNPHDWRIKFGKLAEVVTISADACPSDQGATELVKKVANEMVESIKIALDRFPNARKLPVVLQGGMFEHSELYREIVIDSVKQLIDNKVYLSKLRPVVGALLLAFIGLNKIHDKSAVETCSKKLYMNIQQLDEAIQQLLIRKEGHIPFSVGVTDAG